MIGRSGVLPSLSLREVEESAHKPYFFQGVRSARDLLFLLGEDGLAGLFGFLYLLL